jgi:membrane-bound ClpP family serine protease
MVEWSIVFSLILAGLVLVVIEIFFVPGTTFVGLLGFLCLAIGVAMSFRYFGGTVGWSVAAGSAAITGFVLYQSFRTNVWSRFSLKSTLTGGVHDGVVDQVSAGAEGVALSALRPFGKAEVNNKTYEVRTQGKYVETGTRIRIVQIAANQIIVEPTE